MDYQLELTALVRTVRILRDNQRKYFKSKKTNSYESGSLLQQCKEQEKILDLKISQIEDLLSNKPQQPDLFSLSDKAKERIANAINPEHIENFMNTEERNKRRADAQAKYIADRNSIIDDK